MITLNSISTSLAATDFLLMATGLLPGEIGLEASAYYPQERELRARDAVKRPACRFCGDDDKSALARGDLKALSLKPGARPARAPEAEQVTGSWSRSVVERVRAGVGRALRPLRGSSQWRERR